MSTKEKPEIVTDKHLQYLDALRRGGSTNMYGAGPYLMKSFGVSRGDSHTILAYWMETFADRHPKQS